MPAMKVFVALLANTPNPERVVGAACRLCYSKVGASELTETMTEEEIDRLLKMVFQSGHHSVFEHAVFTFTIEGISRACSHQLVRHRIASYSQQSQRYVRYDEPNYIVPPSISGTTESQMFDLSVREDADKYRQLLKAGVGAEDARFLLPNAIETKIVVTMNARSLFNFFTLRTCERAQWEIRAMAEEMLKLVYPIAPRIFAKSGPACIRGRCPEGKFYCGKPRKLTSEGLIVIEEKDWVYRSSKSNQEVEAEA